MISPSSYANMGLAGAKPWIPEDLGAAIISDWNPLAANVTLNTGKVTNLVDTKGFANMTDGATAARRPTWTAAGPGGYPQMDFDGAAMALGTAAFAVVAQPTTMYLVWKQYADSVAGVSDMLYSNSGAIAMQIQSSVPRMALFGGTGNLIAAGVVPNAANFGVTSVEMNGAASTIKNNGTLLASGTNPGATGMDLVTIGGYTAIGAATVRFLHCSIARVIWTTLLSAANNTLLTNYLRARYATP